MSVTWGDRPRRLDPAHEHSFSSKIGYHIHGPTRDAMWTGVFSLDFLCKPSPGWEVDWDHIDTSAELCTDQCEPSPHRHGRCTRCGHSYMSGILVKHVETHRVWRLTGDMHINDANQEMYEGKWPD
jgi:hypothetical protein